MSRLLKRVPLDFNWEINKIWGGYVNEHEKACSDCNNGWTSARERLSALVRLIMLSGADSLRGENHPYFNTDIRGFYDVVPSKDMAELTAGLSGKMPDYLSNDIYSAERKIIAAAGLDPEVWGICKTCKGTGIDPEAQEAIDSWKEIEPPIGQGFQLWEDVTEGSPQSPVFDTLDSLCEWCETNATTFAHFKASKEDWKKMLGGGIVHHQEGNNIFF